MTADKFMAEGENFVNYPHNLRVLAVDDDPLCLKLLETLLKRCQYDVATTNQAREALKMLRENKDGFDLVISDVHMPDMDGFKLLELVGLEMDLPVIMLSANSDPKLVLKGVTHGACDYLVKPVRIEELKNIWQHVIRRKKFDQKGETKCSDKGKDIQQIGNENQDLNPNRKRKEDDDEENEDLGDDSASTKKARVVWSMDLHRKFVAAVNQLGFEKAVPKKILDLMNVEGLTRENVASHLQKYRLYLKRISSDAKQAAAMNSQFLGSFDNGPVYGRLASSALSPYTSRGLLGGQDTHSNIGIRSLSPSSLFLGNIPPLLASTMQSSGSFQGSLCLDQLQMNKCALGISNVGSVNESRIYVPSNMLNGQGEASSSILKVTPAIPTMQTLSGGGFRSHSSLNPSPRAPTGLLDHVAVESSKMQPNSLISGDPFQSQFSMNSTRRCNDFSASSYLQNPSGVEDSTQLQFDQQRWGEQGLDYSSNVLASFESGMLSQHTSSFLNGRPAGGSSNAMQRNENPNESFAAGFRAMTDDTRSYDSLDDMVNAMIKREEDEAVPNDFGFDDDYSFGVGH